ncbi:hypothetical protein M433DRAFT_7434 [Acidomyces richmondensis BFW]|nr:hypothetical protein M433DRAFT_7434 [Acidomyces richmondensis BFW]
MTQASKRVPSPLLPIITPHLTHLLSTRLPPKTFCPSEVARALTADELAHGGYTGWREAMADVRRAVAAARTRGECEILQQGKVVHDDVGNGLERLKGPEGVGKGMEEEE